MWPQEIFTLSRDPITLWLADQANLIFFILDKRTTIDIYSGCPTAKWTWNSQADNRYCRALSGQCCQTTRKTPYHSALRARPWGGFVWVQNLRIVTAGLCVKWWCATPCYHGPDYNISARQNGGMLHLVIMDPTIIYLQDKMVVCCTMLSWTRL